LRRLLLENAHQTDNLFAAAMQMSRATADSLAALSSRFMSFSANTPEVLDELGKNVRALGAMNEAQANRLAELSRALEGLQQKMQAWGVAPAGVAGTAAAAGVSGQAGQDAFPPPATLLALGQSEFATQACATARSTYGDFLQHYPTNDRAAEAQSAIAQTYSCEGNSAAADSVYQVVVAKYPGTDEAASALFQHARTLCKAGKSSDAIAALRQIVREDTLSTVRPSVVARLNQADPCAE
jgi:hypothetical protein